MKHEGTLFHSPLQHILASELGCGNSIREISDWPPHCRRLVVLDRPFKRRYPLQSGLTFHKINDRHYWKAEYRFELDAGLSECLACGF